MHYCRKLTFFEDSFTVLTLLRSGFHFRYEDVDGLDKLIMETQARIIRAITSNYRLMLYVQEESILTPARDAQTAIKTLYGTWWDLVQNFRIAFLAEAKCSFSGPACVREKSGHRPMNPPNQSRAVVMVGRTG